MKMISYKHYKLIVMFSVFTILSLSIVFLIFSIANTTHSINRLKDDFNDDYAYIYLPSRNIVDYVLLNYTEDISIYSESFKEINSITYPVYSVVSSTHFDIIILSHRFERYVSDSNQIDNNAVYQNHTMIDSVLYAELSTNHITFEPKDYRYFLFERQQIDQVIPENVYLIKIRTFSQSYQTFTSIFGQSENVFSISDSSSFHVLGNKIFESTTSVIRNLLLFFYVLYLIPAILFIVLLSQAYKILLSQSMVHFKIKHLFYQTKRSIVIRESINNFSIFLFNYFIITLIYSLIDTIYSETLMYLLFTLGIVLIVILYTTHKIVAFSLSNETTIEGDVQ